MYHNCLYLAGYSHHCNFKAGVAMDSVHGADDSLSAIPWDQHICFYTNTFANDMSILANVSYYNRPSGLFLKVTSFMGNHILNSTRSLLNATHNILQRSIRPRMLENLNFPYHNKSPYRSRKTFHSTIFHPTLHVISIPQYIS